MATQTIRLRLPALHPAQQQIDHEARRFNVCSNGRRWGKTKYGTRKAAETMLAGGTVGWFAASNKLQAEAWRDLKHTLQPVIRKVSEQEHRIELITGGVLEMWSLESTGAGRGRRYHRVIVDEAAFARNLEADWNQAIRPTLTDYQGDAWFFSTPKGRNYFWTLWQRGQDPEQAEWMSWQMPTLTNPYIRPEEIESARKDLPEREFLQEYEAQFLEDGAGVFRRVGEAATSELLTAGEKGRQYIYGIDWGKHNDFTVFSVIDAAASRQVHLYRSNQIDYVVQLERLRATFEQFPPFSIIAELNSMGEPLVEQLRRERWPIRGFQTTNASKAEIIDGLALAFEQGTIQILPDRVQLGELQAYEAERLPSGLLRYSAPAGLHDDTVMALALAWWGASHGKKIRGTVQKPAGW